MKKYTLIFLLVMVCHVEKTFARIIRVNNNPGTLTQFTTLEAAHTEANNGDTIHLEGSANNYGNAVIVKKLVIIGPGYYLAENPGSQYSPQSARVGNIYMRDGSQGSVITGLHFWVTSLYIQADDIVVKRNCFNVIGGFNNNPEYYVGTISLGKTLPQNQYPVNNILIMQNYGVKIAIEESSSGVLISNNYIINGNCLTMDGHADAVIRNNIFKGNVYVSNGSTFRNNILFSGNFTGSPTIFTNNISNSTQFGTENGNKSDINMTTVFVGLGTAPYSDRQWVLKDDSPAKEAGFSEDPLIKVDAGIFGGQLPYVLAGLPSVPAIYYLDISTIGSDTEPIKGSIKAKSVN